MGIEVWTIGHSNHSAAKFLSLLDEHKINVLVDVRSKPKSRFAHFGRDNLLNLMHDNEVQYLFGGLALGGMSNYGPKDKLFVEKMDKIVELAGEGKRIAMMCSEGKPCGCHRAGKLTAWLHRERKHVQTTHILPTGATTDAREYEPQVIKEVRWPEFKPWRADLFAKA